MKHIVIFNYKTSQKEEYFLNHFDIDKIKRLIVLLKEVEELAEPYTYTDSFLDIRNNLINLSRIWEIYNESE